MNQKDYNRLSEKTLSENFYVTEKKEKNLLHASMGLVTESVELIDNYDGTKSYDKVNIFEELGDISWYLAIIQRELNFQFSFYESNNLPMHKTKLAGAISLIKQTNNLLDYHKKLVFYGKPIEESKYLEFAQKIADDFYYFVFVEEFNLEEIYEKNISKLKARYGDKFNEEGALNRDLENERNILENKHA